MAGIYLHIPFCRKACTYCDFHFSTNLKHKSQLLEAMLQEIEQRAIYLQGETIDTIYFGGGTPSLLEESELTLLLNVLRTKFVIHPSAEITLEANPDDLKVDKLHQLKRVGINRLSIGLQSFSESDLLFMNRAHTASESLACVKLAQDAGFDNLSVDLIYGIPGMKLSDWQKNLEQIAQLHVQHLSCYALTVENGTMLDHQVRKGLTVPMPDAEVSSQFNYLMEWAPKHSFTHYEISNFGKENYFSKHNTSYWQGKTYLGIGPSAHSFNGTSRQWNMASNGGYIQALRDGSALFEMEELTKENQFNEFLMTGLRTMWGCSLSELKIKFVEFLDEEFVSAIDSFKKLGWLIETEQAYVLTQLGKNYADRIASELFKS